MWHCLMVQRVDTRAMCVSVRAASSTDVQLRMAAQVSLCVATRSQLVLLLTHGLVELRLVGVASE